MRILLANPNTSEGVTRRLHDAAIKVTALGTTLIPLTAPRGLPYVATRAEAQIGGTILLEMLAEHHRAADAAIIAAFGDPGLFGARELFDIPVVGMSEAAMLTACMLGRKFVIVTFSEALKPWYRDCVEMHGLNSRCAGVHALGGPFSSILEVRDEMADHLVELANRLVAQAEADVVIFSGAPLAGLTERVKHRIPVPVVDPIQAAVKLGETLVALGTVAPTVGTFRRPSAKGAVGIQSALAQRIEHKDT
jgi:Asp/Glu/hydantoin racemase